MNVLASLNLPEVKTTTEYDLIIIGGTASGVGAAVAAAREGLSVALLEFTPSLGGMIVNGVCSSDVGISGLNNMRGFPNKTGIPTADIANGLFDEFTKKVAIHYNNDPKCKKGFQYEPSVAQLILGQIIQAETNLDVMLEVKSTSAQTTGNKVTSVEVTRKDNQVVTIQLKATGYIIDATDCGDVAAELNIPFWIGREGKAETGEAFAGFLYWDNYGAWNDNEFNFLTQPPYVTTNEGDARIQSYAYMLTIKDYGGTAPNLMTTPPANYNEANYDSGAVLSETWTFTSGVLPNDKFEVNVHPKGSDLQGNNYNYATGGRETVQQQCMDHALGYLYYIQNKLGQKQYGLALDEYTDNNNVPYRLYVRESRRITGYYQFTEFDATPFTFDVAADGALTGTYTDDTERPPFHYDGVAISSYAMDSHATQPYPGYRANDPNVRSLGEGEFYISWLVGPGNIPLRSLVPKTNITNILISQAVSSTHVGYGCLRMEPVRMNMGQACAIIITEAIANNLNLHELITANPKAYLNTVINIQNKVTSAPHNVTTFYYNDLAPTPWAVPAIQTISTWGVTSGFSGYQYKPTQTITRAEVTEMIIKTINFVNGLIPIAQKTQAYTGFSDVAPSDWFYSSVKDANERKIVEGYPDGTFKPSNTITRAELAAILLRAFSIPVETFTESPFTDVPVPDSKNPWYTNTVLTANKYGFMTGVTPTLFEPLGQVNRAQAAVAIYNTVRVLLNK